MNTNNLNTALYEKMATEQEKFRDWLKSQPPEEILHHTYEYTVREDIVMALEELELTDVQAKALLESPSPLADVYRYFEKLETGYMDVIRDSIENRADDVCRAKEELRTTPIYPHSAAYAREHGELEQYRASNNANLQCKESIEAAVREHFDGMYLSHDAAKGVIETYGMERVAMVLANTVQLQDWDGRYSRRNKEWAKTIPNDNPETVRCGYALNSHPAVLDGFIDLVREEQQRSRTQGEKLQPSRPSVRDKLKQELPAHKPAAPKKTGAGAITMAKRKRDVPVLFWVSAEELELIHQKMQQYGTENLSAYLRKMALDGYVVKLDLPEMKELVSLMRRSSNNLNQLTRKVHETGRVYNADLEDISQRQEQLWEGVCFITGIDTPFAEIGLLQLLPPFFFSNPFFCLNRDRYQEHLRREERRFLVIWSGAWSVNCSACSAWRGCAYYLFPAKWCDSASHGIFD